MRNSATFRRAARSPGIAVVIRRSATFEISFALVVRGFDPFVLEKRRRKITQQRLAVTVGTGETLVLYLMRHDVCRCSERRGPNSGAAIIPSP